MPTDVIMPALELAQDFGTLLKWLKSEGQQVTKGEPLMEIETDKVTVEIEAPASGTLAKVSAAPGDKVPVGQVIAWILSPDEVGKPGDVGKSGGFGVPTGVSPQETAPASGGEKTPVAGIEASPLASRIAAENGLDLRLIRPSGARIEKSDVLAFLESQNTKTSGGKSASLVPASPKARRLAAEASLDVGSLAGSGPGGGVLAADVSAVTRDGIPGDAAAPAQEIQEGLSAVSNAWRVMAERVTQSWTTIPHFYLIREVDAGRLQAWRGGSLERFGGDLTYTDLLIYLAAVALRQHPNVNASWRDGAIEIHTHANIGVAVAVEAGLVVPVLHQAETLSLGQVVSARAGLIRLARDGSLGLEDIRGGTFTISNLGMYGVDAFSAIVNPPQAAILAVGRIAERVVPVNGQPAVRHMMTLTLSLDHRVVDGARGAQFLDTLAGLIEEPLQLIE